MNKSAAVPWVIAVAIAIAVTATPSKAGAQTEVSAQSEPAKASAESADAYLERGLAHYEAREFEEAIAEFLTGYGIEPRSEFLFALAQAERRSGDCASALIYYRQFIDTGPPDAQIQAARMHIDGCRVALSSQPAGEKEQEEPEPVAAPAAPQPAPWYHDWVGDSLLGAGTVSLLVGVGLVAASESARDRAAWVETYPEYDLHMARARRYRIWGTVALSAAAGLAAGALYRFHRGGDDEQRRDLGVSMTGDGLTLSYGGRF